MNNLYTRKSFGAELILELENPTFSIAHISMWADRKKYEYVGKMEEGIDEALQDLSAMAFSEEFEMSKKEIEDMAIYFIAQNK